MSSDPPDDDDEFEPMPTRPAELFELPDDDEFNAWLLADLPPEGVDDFDIDPKLPPKLQEEHDRLAAELEISTPSRLRLAPDLLELERKIEYAALNEKAPRVMLHRFLALASIRGGMGLVLEAYDPLFERLVAIKLLMRPGPEAQEALRTEAVTLAKLNKYRNVVTLYEPGIWNGHLYIVMEWIEGVDGHEWMRRPRPWQAVREVFIEAGTGLAAAHDTKIQHGDFKPSNILIGDDGRVVVADFGLADSLSSSSEREESDKVAGTTCYMAPERLGGKRGDARSDQFSFCVAMFRALCRQRPFAGETTAELIESIERAEIQETPGVDVPSWLIAVLRKGLAYSPDERYRDMRELLDALRDDPPDQPADHETVIDDQVVEVVGRVLHKSIAGPARKPSRVAYFVALALVFVSVLLGVLAETSLLIENSQPDAEPAPLPAHPCAGFDSTDPNVNVDPVVHEVCRLIRDDHVNTADMLWEREYLDRYTPGRIDIVLGEDALVVASTFLEHAEALESKEPSRAAAAAESGLAWMLPAAIHLGQGDPRVQDIKARFERIIANAASGA